MLLWLEEAKRRQLTCDKYKHILHTSIYLSIYLSIYIYMYIKMCVYTYIYIYMYAALARRSETTPTHVRLQIYI